MVLHTQLGAIRCAAALDVIFPVLESGRTKALQGQKGGRVSPNASKSKQKDNDNIKNNFNDNIKHKCDVSELGENAFDIFWDFYPKKVGRIPASEKFAEVEVPLQVLLKAIKEQQQSLQWQRDGGAFIPNPATWLQERRWEDELPRKEEPVPKGASGLLGEAELKAIEKILGEEC